MPFEETIYEEIKKLKNSSFFIYDLKKKLLKIEEYKKEDKKYFFKDYNEVVENSAKSLNFNLGLGYTIVWREHFAVEPFMNLTFMNGEQKVYNSVDRIVESNDLKGTHFNLGVNFSLFF